MQTIPSDILTQYEDALKKRAVPVSRHADYRKWLRYFLDFRSKYPQPESKSEQVRLFILKLQAKNQSTEQQEQAAHAVSLFFESQNAETATTPAGHRNHNSPSPPLILTNSRCLKQRGGEAGGVTIKGEYSTSSQYRATTGGLPLQVSEEATTPSPSPSPDRGEGNNTRSHFNDWRCLKKSASPEWDALVDKLADEIKTRHYSRKTLKAYADWGRNFQGYLKNKSPEELSSGDVKAYLTHLAVNCKVAASTQNQAFNALLFLYRHILKKDFGEHKDIPRAKKSTYIPVVL